MNVSKYESGVIPNGAKDSINILYSVFFCYPKSDTNEGHCIVFPYMWPLIKEIYVINWWYLFIIYITLIW
jgi:hypothetical protein